MEQSHLVELYREAFIQQKLTDALPCTRHCDRLWKYGSEDGSLHVWEGLTIFYSSRLKEMVEVPEMGTMSQRNYRERPQPSLEGPSRQSCFRESGWHAERQEAARCVVEGMTSLNGYHLEPFV